jgi:hypothetical protein
MLPPSSGTVTWPSSPAYLRHSAGSSLEDTPVLPSCLGSACATQRKQQHDVFQLLQFDANTGIVWLSAQLSCMWMPGRDLHAGPLYQTSP